MAGKRERKEEERQLRFLHFPKKKTRQQRAFETQTFLTAVLQPVDTSQRTNSVAPGSFFIGGRSGPAGASVGGLGFRASVVGGKPPGGRPSVLPRDSVADVKLPPVNDIMKKSKEPTKKKEKAAGGKFANGTHTIMEEGSESPIPPQDGKKATRRPKKFAKSKALSADPKTKLADGFYGLSGSAEGRAIKDRAKKADKAGPCDPTESLMPHKMLVRKAQAKLMNKLGNQLVHYRHQIKMHFKKIIQAVEVQYSDTKSHSRSWNLSNITNAG